jgi:chemotaxis-related protein WspD
MNSSATTTQLESARCVAGQAETAPELQDCWNKTGVAGDGTCAELAKRVHCRNCLVFYEAGARLLERLPSPEYQRELTERFAEPKAEKTPGKLPLVIFRIGTEWLALPALVLQEVSESRPIHSLPHRRDTVVLGLANVRGELLTCVSVGRLLGLEPDTRKEKPGAIRDRLLVVNWDGRRLAFPVDEVGGIERCQPQELRQAPATVARSAATFARGVLSWRGKSVGCLDEELLLTTLHRNLS